MSVDTTDAATRPTGGRPHSALLWSFANIFVTKLGTVFVGILMARLLGPANFGTFAVAFLAVTAVLSFNELGVSLAIVRWPGDPRVIGPTVTTISVVSSLVLGGAMALAAVPYADAMGEPDAAPLVALLALCVVISGVSATPAAFLQRHLMQGRRMLIDQVATFVTLPVIVGLALAGAGATALVVGNLVGSLITALLFIRMSPEPWRLGFDRTHAAGLLRFGLPLAVTSLLVFGVGFADQLVVGGTLGVVALGAYAVAYNLSSWPVTMLSRPLRQVTPVIFARLQHDPARLRDAFERLAGLVLTVTLPGCAALAILAPEVVHVLYGSTWHAAAAPLAWLAALAFLRILFELVYDYLVVAGSTRDLLRVQVVWLVALLPALAAGAAALGVGGVGLAAFAVAAVVVLPLYGYHLADGGIRTGALVARALLPAAGAALVVAVTLGARLAGAPALVTCVVTGVALLAVLGALLRRQREDLAWMRSGAGGEAEARTAAHA